MLMEKYNPATGLLEPVTGVDFSSSGGGATPGRETTITPTQVVLTAATSAALKTATTGRIRFVIYNPTSSVLYVRKAASAASATAFDFIVPASGSYFSDPYEWAGEIRAFSTPGGTINYSESV